MDVLRWPARQKGLIPELAGPAVPLHAHDGGAALVAHDVHVAVGAVVGVPDTAVKPTPRTRTCTTGNSNLNLIGLSIGNMYSLVTEITE